MIVLLCSSAIFWDILLGPLTNPEYLVNLGFFSLIYKYIQ